MIDKFTYVINYCRPWLLKWRGKKHYNYVLSSDSQYHLTSILQNHGAYILMSSKLRKCRSGFRETVKSLREIMNRTYKELLKCKCIWLLMKIRVKFWQLLQRSGTNKQLALNGISCSQQNANAGMLCKQVNYQIAKANFAECCFQLVVVCRKDLFVFVCVHLRGFKIKIIVECCTRLVYVCAKNILQQIQRNIDYK